MVFGLLAATGVAFTVAERLKLAPIPIDRTHITSTFSTVCECDRTSADIAFRLRRADRLTVAVLDTDRQEVRRLASTVRVPAGPQSFTWDGRLDDGTRAPDGRYFVRVRLAHEGRIINMPNEIVVDTVPPRLTAARARPSVISPDGDGHSDGIAVPYRVSEHAHAFLFVNGHRRVVGRFPSLTGKLRWYGRRHGRGVAPGSYRITLVARDLAGNSSVAQSAGTIRVRYVAIARPLLRVQPGGTLHVPLLTDAERVSWKLGPRRGRGTAPLVLRAPDRPGTYRLTVTVDGHRARARVRVGRGR